MSGQKNEVHIQVFNLASKINYQEGSVVSREIVNKPTGTVTLFAFDQGQGLSKHSAPYSALVYIIEGKAVVTISEKPYKLQTGEFIIMPANKTHSLEAIEKFKMVLVMIKS